MLSLLDIPVLAAAAFAVTRAWFQGSVFAASREKLKLWRDGESRLRQFVGELASCPLCLSGQAVLALALVLLLPATLLEEPWATLFRLPLYAFAAWAIIPIAQAAPSDEDAEG